MDGAGAEPDAVSPEAKHRQRDQLGTLGSGNHYLEVQAVVEIFDDAIARAYGLASGDVVMSIHCGSRGLGHQIGTDYLKSMLTEAKRHSIELSERELACAPIDSKLGRDYLGCLSATSQSASAAQEPSSIPASASATWTGWSMGPFAAVGGDGDGESLWRQRSAWSPS